jgi:hypothetical protein
MGQFVKYMNQASTQKAARHQNQRKIQGRGKAHLLSAGPADRIENQKTIKNGEIKKIGRNGNGI